MSGVPIYTAECLEGLAARDQPARALEAYSGICRLHLHFDLMTVLAYDEASDTCVRVYSSSPAYALGWRGQLTKTEWGSAVLRDGQVWEAPDAAAIRKAFDDGERILASGCRTMLCIPSRFAGKTLGAASFLANRLRYDEKQLLQLRLFTALLAAPLLHWRAENSA